MPSRFPKPCLSTHRSRPHLSARVDLLAKSSNGEQRIKCLTLPAEHKCALPPLRPAKHFPFPLTIQHTPISLCLASTTHSTHLFATTQGTWTPEASTVRFPHYSHRSYLLPLAPEEVITSIERTTSSVRVRGKLPFFFFHSGLPLIQMSVVQTQICGSLPLDTMAGYNPQKSSVRIKAGAARYIAFSSCVVFYCENHVVRKLCI